MKNIKIARERLGLTQKELADKVFVTSKTIFNYESGLREPDVNTLIKLSEVLNVQVDFLIGVKQQTHMDELREKINELSREELIELINKLLDIVEVLDRKKYDINTK